MARKKKTKLQKSHFFGPIMYSCNFFLFIFSAFIAQIPANDETGIHFTSLKSAVPFAVIFNYAPVYVVLDVSLWSVTPITLTSTHAGGQLK